VRLLDRMGVLLVEDRNRVVVEEVEVVGGAGNFDRREHLLVVFLESSRVGRRLHGVALRRKRAYVLTATNWLHLWNFGFYLTISVGVVPERVVKAMVLLLRHEDGPSLSSGRRAHLGSQDTSRRCRLEASHRTSRGGRSAYLNPDPQIISKVVICWPQMRMLVSHFYPCSLSSICINNNVGLSRVILLSFGQLGLHHHVMVLPCHLHWHYKFDLADIVLSNAFIWNGTRMLYLVRKAVHI